LPRYSCAFWLCHLNAPTRAEVRCQQISLVENKLPDRQVADFQLENFLSVCKAQLFVAFCRKETDLV